MSQGGDPLGEGYGGESLGAEVRRRDRTGLSTLRGHYERGTVPMANQTYTNGSQFFISTSTIPCRRVHQIRQGDRRTRRCECIAGVENNHNDKPAEKVVMERVYIEEAA